ncbi:MAG: hypothetical protein GY811_01590 [Myxococcales bacterium]|nr:hypothetical protein [Myxococcales bacterium]
MHFRSGVAQLACFGSLPNGVCFANAIGQTPYVSTPQYRIHIKRDRYKFSCAHMTVFPGGRKERMHGHNYYVSLTVELSSIDFEHMVDFGPLKKALANLCNEWKEHVLLATKNPYYELVSDTEKEIEFALCGHRYVLPREDVLLMPIDNLAVEPLSNFACERLCTRMGAWLDHTTVKAIEVTIEENPGQGATTRHEF